MRFARTAVTALVASTALIGVHAANANAATTDLFISEYIEGSSFNKAIEIYNGTGASVDLSAYSLELYSNGSPTASQSVTLSGSLADGDVFVAAHGSADPAIQAQTDLTVSTVINFNGDDAVVLRKNGTVIDSFGQVGLDPGSEWPGGGADDTLRRKASVCTGDTNPDDSFDAGAEYDLSPINTFDGLGTHTADCGGTPPPPPPPIPAPPIFEVQGDGVASPLVGQRVVVDGVVVGDFQNNSAEDDGNLRGFFLQEPDSDADGDPSTSDGVFVFDGGGSVDVAAGDFVSVTGTVVEFNGLTEIGSLGDVTVVSSGNPLPTATTFSLPAEDADREALEGMYVTLPQDLVISEYFNFDRFGEIVLTTERQYQPTAVYEPGSDEAAALAAANLLGRITLDDGRSAQNPDPAIHPNGEEFDLDNLFRGGDTVANVTGVMDYSFGLYRIQPTEGADHTAVNDRPAVPEVGGDIEVASFNVLNYFTTLGSRGAATPEEFERQRAKIIAALSEIDADVVGLIEIENNTEAIADLVAGLNDELGAGTYAFIDTGVIGTDEIKVAFIYQPASVLPVGEYAILDSSVDPRFIDDKNRPALAQTFLDLSTGSPVTVAVNHLKSKGSDCNDIGDIDLGDGAGNCNLTRTAAAAALADWMGDDPTGTGVERSLIIGDLNSYDKEDPIDVLVAAGYTDLVAQFGGEYAYSYVFDGQLGYLDHALANDPLLPDVNDTEVWHINADEPDLIDYLMGFKQDAQDAIYAPDPFRSSDHDPVLIGINGTLDADLVLGLAADEVRELLASGTINRGQATALLKHLGNAIAKIDAGNGQAARSMLDGIDDQLDDFVADGILTDEEAAMLRLLIDAALGGLS